MDHKQTCEAITTITLGSWNYVQDYVLEKQASCGKIIPLQYIKQKHDSGLNILFIFRFVGDN
jgi:hypothetical protein